MPNMQRITFFERQIIEVGLRNEKSVRAITKEPESGNPSFSL